MLTFLEFVEILNEKLILYNHGKREGQAVFLAGGAASGKGHAIKKFVDSSSFKIFDVDYLKTMILKMNQLKGKFPEISHLNLRNPEDVGILHQFIKDLDWEDKILGSFFSDRRSVIPNVLFDVTMKDMKKLNNLLPILIGKGYRPRDIHITWVLAKYSISVNDNAKRSRVVPDDILLQTHEGASRTMYSLISGDLPAEVNGRVDVILNNRENTIYWEKNGEKTKIPRDFIYLNIKEEGKPIKTERAVKEQLLRWIDDNVPLTTFARP